MEVFLWLWMTQSIFLTVWGIGQNGGVCDGDTCYFLGRQAVMNPDEGNWACQNEFKDANFVNPLGQSAFDDVTDLLVDLSKALTVETLYASDQNAEAFQQSVTFCGGPDDTDLYDFYFGDVDGDGRKDFACHKKNDGMVRWCTDWTSLGHCDIFEYTGYCTDDVTNYFGLGNFISDLGHDTVTCMLTDGRFWVSYDAVFSERHYQDNGQDFCSGSGRLHMNDINSDGITDYVCNTPGGSPTNTAILSVGDGTVGSTAVAVTTGSWCGADNDVFLSADFNGDNSTDIVCLGRPDGWVYIEIADTFPFAGSSTWSQDIGFCESTDTTVIVGDFNADGLDDIGCHYPAEAKIDIAYSAGSSPYFQGIDRTIENFCPRNSDAYLPRVFAERLHSGEGHTIICVRESRPKAGVVGTLHDPVEWTWSSSDKPVTSLTWGEIKYSTARYDTYNCGSEGTVFHDDYMIMYAYGTQHLCTIILDKDPSIGTSSYSFTLHMANIGSKGGTTSNGHYGMTFNFQDENNFEYIYVLPHQQDNADKSCFKWGYVKDGMMTGFPMNDCVNRINFKGWTKLTVDVDYSLGTAKAYIDDDLQAEWMTMFGGGRVGACAYNPNQQALVAFSYFDVNPGIPGTNSQPKFMWKTHNCLSDENVLDTDGTLTLRGDESRPWDEGSAYCILPAIDATPYDNNYEFSVQVHFSNDVDLNQAGIIFNVQDDTHFDVLYLRPYAAGCLIYGYYADANHLQYPEVTCGDPGIHANDWNIIHITVHADDQLVRLYINNDYITSWNYHFTGGAVGANTLNGFPNVMKFKDFTLEARDWTSYNCDNSGWYDIMNQQYVMVTKPSPGASYPEDQLCQSVYTGSSLPTKGLGYVYTGKMDLTSETGHPGFVFNHQDENNYEFAFVRPQNAVNCFQVGVVSGGVLTSEGDNTECGDANGVGDDWIDFKLVMDAENSLATAYIDGKFAKEWTTTFTSGNVGGAALNGFTNTITYKDVQVGRIDGSLNPKNYDTYNCGTGQTIFGDEIELFADGATGWEDGHFCQVIASTIPCNEEYMYYEIEITSVGDTSTQEGHPAIIFNWQHETSYEFVYYRPHASDDCVEYGYFEDLSPNLPPRAVICSSLGVTVAANSPNTYAVELMGTAVGSTVNHYLDGVLITTSTTHFSRGHVGFGAVNVPSNPDQAKANYFAPEGLQCRPEKPTGLEGDFSIISGKDGLTYGTNVDEDKDLLYPICTVPSASYNAEDEYVVFRVAAGYGGSTSLYTLWTDDAVEPAANQSIDRLYFSRSAMASGKLFKSPIVDNAWSYATTAKLTLYKHANPVATVNFDVSGTTKNEWFTNSKIVGSSYADMEEASTSTHLEGFQIVDNLDDCSQGQGWLYISEQGSVGSCSWETDVSDKPAFFYSPNGMSDTATNWQQAEVMTITIRMNDSAFGGSCVWHCIGMVDGDYASCYGCNVYSKCEGEVLKPKSCHDEYEFDYNTGQCTESSSSCTGSIVTGVHLPDVCGETDCGNGYCHMTSTGWDCVCDDGYEGMNCETNIDECLAHQCDNGATCVDGVAEYSCNCTETWTGDLCEDYDYCHDDPCVNGECENGESDYSCDCPDGYSGTNCDEEDRCILDNVQCEHGDCLPFNGSCSCEEGYVGDLCDTDNPCLPNPCNTGSCTMEEDLVGINCTCPTYYSGDRCQDYDDCGVEPCKNDGTCSDIGDDFQCDCEDGFVGKDCDTVDRCFSEVTCSNEGTCQSPEGTCDCTDGWTGDTCADVDNCHPHPCNNNGECVNGESDYTCDCNEAYVGAECSLDNPCVAQQDVCKHNATCESDDEANINCICTSGFEGDLCETGPCEKNDPCNSNGECTNLMGGAFQCACTSDYVGEDCSIANPCNLNPCDAGDSCNPNDDGTYECENWNVQDGNTGSGIHASLTECLLVFIISSFIFY